MALTAQASAMGASEPTAYLDTLALKPLNGLEDCREFCKSHPHLLLPLPILPRVPKDILLIVTYKSGKDVGLGHHQSYVEAQGRNEHACGTDQRISFVVYLP